jgi:hypothetical protein
LIFIKIFVIIIIEKLRKENIFGGSGL